MQIHYFSHYNVHTPTEDSIFPDEDGIVQNYVSDISLPSERPDISTTTTYDVAVFNNNIEAEVNEASDIVCNGRLDIGDLVVEQNETDNEEEITAFAKLPPICMLTTADNRTTGSQKLHNT